jgi:RNA polymerase sigma-70 factor (ECF subfamily)
MPEVNGNDERLEGSAFEAFYARTAASLWAFAARVGGDPALADDIVQEAFIRYLNNVRPELAEQQQKAFLFKIASRLLTDHFRRHTALPLKTAEGVKAAGGIAQGREILSSDLRRLFGSLPPRDRALLWLAYAEGHSHHEIADILGLKVASIKVKLFRLRRSFAARLRESGYRPEEYP